MMVCGRTAYTLYLKYCNDKPIEQYRTFSTPPRPVSVSYTHLDVYKRQIQIRLFVNFILIELFRLLLIHLETSDDTDIFQ